MSLPVFVRSIATAVPSHDIHHAFVGWARGQIADDRARRLFERAAARSGIDARWSVLPVVEGGGSPVAPGGFYDAGSMPPTSRRMLIYAAEAPALAERAARGLGDLAGVTHLVVASCTGFVAPGIDQLLADRLGLPAHVERVLIGFMGCYAAVTALRTARHIVRSEPAARVLVVTVELSTLHLQPATAIEPLLAMLQFGDGAAAALVSADPGPIELGRPLSATLPASADLIRWDIGDTGFAMHLSGEVPGRLAAALRDDALRARIDADGRVEEWAVHAGGRSILDAVGDGLGLAGDALDDSRAVLRAHGNMSSATLMFVLARKIGRASGPGMALAFGPGLAAEGIGYRLAA